MSRKNSSEGITAILGRERIGEELRQKQLEGKGKYEECGVLGVLFLRKVTKRVMMRGF